MTGHACSPQTRRAVGSTSRFVQNDLMSLAGFLSARSGSLGDRKGPRSAFRQSLWHASYWNRVQPGVSKP